MSVFFSADYVLPVSGEAVRDGVVEVSDDGKVIGVFSADDPRLVGQSISKHRGIITPGFVNMHCHLELSHLKGAIPKKTGLIDFIQHVIRYRDAEESQIRQAMADADREMYKNGIVAVGDHANTAVSAEVKRNSPIHYHTFVEALAFEPELAEQKMTEATAVAEQFDRASVSITPHAPYSVSKDLLRLVLDDARRRKKPLSIHNQECEEENRFFRYKSGQFLDFYEQLGKDTSCFKAQARNSLQTLLPHVSPGTPILLVHNTYTSSKDIFFVERQGRDVTWCFCPKANLYIEATLPKLNSFLQYAHSITLGTDSLASNEGLCILSELKTLHRHFPELALTETIKWITINGARFLGIDHTFGSLDKGKRPGLNLLTHNDGLTLTPESGVVRLI